MTEARRRQRSQLLFHLDVEDVSSRQSIGRLVDITSQGLRVLGDAPLPPGRRCRIGLDMPIDMGGAGVLEFDAVVVWSQPLKGYGGYTTGFGHLGLNAGQRERLDAVIAAYAEASLA